MNDALPREVLMFNAALQLPANQRADYLSEACGDDGELRGRVSELLQAHEEAVLFLPESDHRPSSIADAAILRQRDVGMNPLKQPGENCGDRVGSYKLLQQIGEGGCGIVYMAEQEEPVRRRVALKVIKLGMDTKQVIARFEAERQALAMMEHPNIAKVFDAGATATGRPYFVMELVRGVQLTDFCDTDRLSTEARLRLFIEVCHAIQHAHQKGVIHRDIKPTNILVPVDDGVPVPKVIDFGIAKATQGRLTDQTFFTAFEQFIGTPAYMSPEQAVLTSVEVDTRSDIYSLGVLLYELLTGQTPFAQRELLASGLDEMRRTIREKDPVRPSTCLSAMVKESLATVARNRGSQPPQLIRLVRGDLDWIVLKCLQKDRARRYETANALAMDIERHLNHQPVLARPDSRAYRVGKFVRRNRVPVTVATAVVSVIAATGFFFWDRAILAREVAKIRQGIIEYPQLEAQLRASKSGKEREGVEQQVFVQLGQKLKIDPSILREKLPTLAEQLKLSPNASSYERANAAYTAKDYLEAERLALKAADEALQGGNVPQRIKALEFAGLSAQRKVEYARAMQRFREAEKLTDRERNPLGWADVQQAIAELLHDDGKDKESETILRDVIEVRLRLLGPEHPDSLRSRNSLSAALTYQGKFAEAEANYRDLIKSQEKLLGSEHLDTLASRNGLAGILDKQGKYAESEAEIRAVLALREKVLGPEHVDTLRSRNNLASSIFRQGRLGEAEAEFRSVIKLKEKLLGSENPSTLQSRSNLTHCLTEQGKYAQAEAETRVLIKLQEKVLGPEHIDTLHSNINLVANLKHLGKYTEAEVESRSAITLSEKLLGPEHPVTLQARDYLAGTLNSEGKYGAAEVEYHTVIALSEKALGPEHPQTLDSRSNLAATLAHEGKYNKAEAESRMVIKLSEKVFGPEHDHALSDREVFADALAGQAKYAEAESEYGYVIRIRTKSLGSEHPSTLGSRSHLARTLMVQGKDAAPEMRQVIQLQEKVIGPEHPDTLASCYDLASGLEGQGKTEEAQQFAQRAAEGARKVLGSEHPATIQYEKRAADLLAKR